jgi:hypothetical protein
MRLIGKTQTSRYPLDKKRSNLLIKNLKPLYFSKPLS